MIDLKTLLTNFQREMDEDSVALFLGAGMSLAAGFVNWKALMHEIAEELGLDVAKETDLIALAQYHKNTRKGRHRINQHLVTEFTKDAVPTDNHKLIASLPVSTIWTTNYDHLIEDAFETEHKRVDVKRRPEDLAVTKARTHVTIYKMHGDIDAPDEAVLTKDDYATFEQKRHLFSTQLRGHLVQKSFLFLGYSFSDPNLEYVLARIRSLLGENKREHYCVLRRVSKTGDMTQADVDYQARQQELRIDDLKNYGIQTHLIEDYSEITLLLRELQRRAVRRHVFVSGSADDFDPLGRDRLEKFARALGTAIVKQGLNLVSGLGEGIGGAVTVGALQELYTRPTPQIDDRVLLRPFPQVQPSTGKLEDLWERYRGEMLGKAWFAIYISGNRKDPGSGQIVEAKGVLREFELASDRGVYPIPVGATGHAARRISDQVLADPSKYYGGKAAQVVPFLQALADPAAGETKWLEAIVSIVKTISPK